MKNFKIGLACAGSAFLLFWAVDLIVDLVNSQPSELSYSEQVVVAVLLNLFITGSAALPGFVLPTNQLMPGNYFSIHKPERLKNTYNLLGVDKFRRLLMIFFWGLKRNRKKYFDGTRSGLNNLEYQSLQSETGHFLALVMITLASIVLLIKGYYISFITAMIINILANLYPTLLQRMHRFRVKKLRT